MSSNCVSRLLPSISAVMPVRSEMKKTVRRLGTAAPSAATGGVEGRPHGPDHQSHHTGVSPAGSGGRSPRSIQLSPGAVVIRARGGLEVEYPRVASRTRRTARACATTRATSMASPPRRGNSCSNRRMPARRDLVATRMREDGLSARARESSRARRCSVAHGVRHVARLAGRQEALEDVLHVVRVAALDQDSARNACARSGARS